MLQVKNSLCHNSIIQIHSGNSSIWSSPWLPNWNNIHEHMILPVTQHPIPATVSDLWHPNTQTWNDQPLSNLFDAGTVLNITAIPTVHSDQPDVLRWTPAKDGSCSTRNVYRHLSRQSIIQLPSQGSRSITTEANNILQRAWKSKDLPPLIKAFTWRLIRTALASAERASRYTTHIDKHCVSCGAVETDAHLFFHCHLPRAV